MITNIKELKNHSLDFIEKFLKECTIEEKIDAYYVSIEIRSKRLILRKANGKEITQEDLILNSMYGRLRKDWEFFRIANEQFFAEHVGYRIYMFYLPSKKPILTEYMSGIGYIIDRITKPNAEIDAEALEMILPLNYTSKFGIVLKKPFSKREDEDGLYREVAESVKSGDFQDVEEIIDFQKSSLFAANVPEGYIFRTSGKNIYQYICSEDIDEEKRVATSEKAQFEYLLMDFIHYWEQLDGETSLLVSGDYVKTVCSLFNDYIQNSEKFTHKIENNLDENSLEAPCVGQRFDVGYEFIPDITTRVLCHEKALYKNIFRILLVNLSREKKLEHCILMNKEKVKSWNTIVKTIKNISIRTF